MIQDQFLAVLKKSQVPVTIYLVSGIRLQGTVEAIDQYGVLLGGNSQQFIFKHAISTIVPSRDVSARAPTADVSPRQQTPSLDLSSADGQTATSEVSPVKKEVTTSAPVVRVKRAGGTKLKLANSDQD